MKKNEGISLIYVLIFSFIFFNILTSFSMYVYSKLDKSRNISSQVNIQEGFIKDLERRKLNLESDNV